MDTSLSNYTLMDLLNTTDSSPCTLRLSSLACFISVRSDRLPVLLRRRCSLAVLLSLSLQTPRGNLSLAISRFISVELHGEDSFVAENIKSLLSGTILYGNRIRTRRIGPYCACVEWYGTCITSIFYVVLRMRGTFARRPEQCIYMVIRSCMWSNGLWISVCS